ncbi:MAG: hypothetical protein HYY34_02515 [Chloroflexi bacterium]|nr:hypothetical protein [Chloroflexota bacterium]
MGMSGSWKVTIVGGLAAVALLAAACGGEKIVERTVVVEKPVEVVKEKIVEKPVEVIKEKIVEKTVVVVQTATAVPTPAAAPESAKMGGKLSVALAAGISTLDVGRTTGTTASTPSYAVQEFLLAYDENLIAQPLLVDTWSLSQDSKKWSFKLREGIKFHDGTPLTAEHAVKSWLRWADRDNFGNTILTFVDKVNATGELTFDVNMLEPSALVLEGMARIGGYYPVIIPPKMYNIPAATGADVMIGTGPYKVKQYLPGDRLTVDRYDGYKPSSLKASFMSGKKVAYFDEVAYVIVPDQNSRIAALKTGQIDILDTVPGDFYKDLSKTAGVTVQIITNNSNRQGAWIDNVDGIFKDKRVRQAFAMAYPVEDALRASFGDSQFWTACPSMMLCGTKWGNFADGSQGIYNARDVAKAKQLVKAAGVEGATVIVLSPEDLPIYANPALISRKVLESIGFKVDFKATDWATQTNWREKPELWDVFHTAGGGAWGANPLLNSSLAKNKYWNKYQDETGRMTAGMDKLARATSAEQQLAIVKEMQLVFWEDIPYVSFGDSFNTAALRSDVANSRTSYGMPFNVFNSWREKK